MAEDTIIAHFSHPGHELAKRHYVGPFICDMCWEDLSGPAYGCRAGCDFAIHDSCAGHPRTLFSPAHHPHQLKLTQIDGRDVTTFVCDVCAGSCAPRCFLYRCPTPCGFDMHPRCARLPPVVRSSLHPEHDLTLVLAQGRCAASACTYDAGRTPMWFYRCSACSLDLHASCAAADGSVVRHDENGHSYPDAAHSVGLLGGDENGHCYPDDAADGVGHCYPDAVDGVGLDDDENGHFYPDATNGVVHCYPDSGVGYCYPDAHADGVGLDDDENGHFYPDAADGVGLDDIHGELVSARISTRTQIAMATALAKTIAGFNLSDLV